MEDKNYPEDWEDWMYEQWLREQDEEEVEPTFDLL